ncbi:MAG: hypothetical protein ACLUOF_07935 [Ruminococcus sp.]
MTEQEHPWETVPEQDAVPETSPAENTDTPDTPIAVSNPDAVLPPDEPTEPDGLKPFLTWNRLPFPPSRCRRGFPENSWESCSGRAFAWYFRRCCWCGAGTGGVLHHPSGKGRVPRRLYGYDLLGKGNLDSGKLISPDFSYACLLPFGGSLLMLLFLPFFGLSMTTHMLGMLLFFLLLTAVLLDAPEMHWDYRWLYHSGDLPHDSQRQQKAP